MAVKKKASPTAKKAAPKKAAPKRATPAATKAAPRKTAPKKATPAATKAAPAVKAIGTKMTKLQILAHIAETTGLPRKDVGAVFNSLADLLEAHLKRRGSGEFTIPEAAIKVVRKKRPATKSRKMVSPFTGEEITVKAKPATNVVRLTALKRLKDTTSK